MESEARSGTFRSLRHRDFRLLWIGLITSAVGTWMQIFAQSLLVLDLTHRNAFYLGSVSLASAIAFIVFALVGGSFADRIDKRKLLLFTQSISALLAFLLGVLTVTHVIQFWMIFVISFVNGVVLSFDQPTRGALVTVLVPNEDLMNAISLQSVVFQAAGTLGPALGGVVVGLLGYSGAFFLNAISYIGVLVALYIMHVPPIEQQHRPPMLDSIKEALHTVKRDAVLPWVLSGYATLLFFGPSLALILPVYGVSILRISPAALGLLFASSGIGAIIGALVVATVGERYGKGTLFFSGILVWFVSLGVFAESRLLWLSFLVLVFFGFGQIIAATVTITLLQTRVPPNMRGRVMSLNTLLNMGVRPLGDFPVGAAITSFGAPITVMACAAMVAIYATGIFSLKPSVRGAA